MPIVAANKESISRAAEALARGEIVAFPTETVYGLGGDATQGRAVARGRCLTFRRTHRLLVSSAQRDAPGAPDCLTAVAGCPACLRGNRPPPRSEWR